MSLLVIQCPHKPFVDPVTLSPSDWQDLACAERFEWALLTSDSKDEVTYGVGTTESMPYADEALVLMPTLDVRLIEAKVPLANAKKLQQVLPNLIEEYVIGGAEGIAVQALAPVPGRSVLSRTLALIDRKWFAWLSQQLAGLLCDRIRLIPDCLLLNGAYSPTMTYQVVESNIIFTRRTGEQLGQSWVELGSDKAQWVLPHSLAAEKPMAITWDWLLPSAQEYIQQNSSSKSANFALNLLRRNFKRPTHPEGLAGLWSSGRAFLQGPGAQNVLGTVGSAGSASLDALAAARMAWTDPMIWLRPQRWIQYLVLSVVAGFAIHLAWLGVANWRWSEQMQLLAAQSLNPSSLSNPSAVNSQDVLSTFVKQVTHEQRRIGVVVDADFAAMAAKLEQLKIALAYDAIQSLTYDGYAIDFELKHKANVDSKTASDRVLQQARAMGLMVKVLGVHQYRLEPYAGLGVM